MCEFGRAFDPSSHQNRPARPRPIFTRSHRKVVTGDRGSGLGARLGGHGRVRGEEKVAVELTGGKRVKELVVVLVAHRDHCGPSLVSRRGARRWWQDGVPWASREGEGEEGKQREKEVARAGVA